MTRQCPQCQAPILDMQRFCRYCGYRLDEGLQDYVETATMDQTQSPAPYAAQYPSGYQSWSPMGSQPACLMRGAWRSKFRYGLPVGRHGMLSLILVCALGAGIVFFSETLGWKAPRFFSSQPIAGSHKSYIGVYFGDDGAGGALIDGVATEGGPADLAGLIGGDLIIEAGRQTVASESDMRRVLASTPPGSQLKIKFLRDGQQIETVLVTAEQGHFLDELVAKPHGFFGIDPDALKRVRVPDRDLLGVRLDKVYTNSPADMAGIREGDIVMEFGGHPIRTPRELIRRFRQTGPYSTIEVKVIRRGEGFLIPVKMGRKD
ncbi:MAG: PDZ domain-containing protein [Acidobacteria bacterium]|nr:PDZ domain-containing protein [Acidobacteriota bacterium]